jgi:uncharacterized membrane protein
MPNLIAYLTTAFVFLAVDSLWLGLLARDFYASQLGELMRPEPQLAVAALFYTLYAGGIVVFAVAPALVTDSLVSALWRGALLGFLAYGTYDLTNLATLRGWPVPMSIVDMAWGTLLTAGAAAAGFTVARRFVGD